MRQGKNEAGDVSSIAHSDYAVYPAHLLYSHEEREVHDFASPWSIEGEVRSHGLVIEKG